MRRSKQDFFLISKLIQSNILRNNEFYLLKNGETCVENILIRLVSMTSLLADITFLLNFEIKTFRF